MCFVRVDGSGEVRGLVLAEGELERVDDRITLIGAFPDATREELDAFSPEALHAFAEEVREAEYAGSLI